MTIQVQQTGSSQKTSIRDKDIQGFKYLDSFFKTLNRLHDVRDNHHRKLHDADYVVLEEKPLT